jgi:2-polyprenyl-6-methoxyphenol hydroxylase-like FAD-dependent oxidoreductase
VPLPAESKRILISGAGISGPTLAWWLARFGFEPTIVEIAPHFRTGGYMIDFWGKGFDLVDRMGLLPEVERAGYHVQEVRLVRSDGSRAGGFSVKPFYKATGGRFISLARGDLAKIIWNALPDGVETRFGDEVASIESHDAGVRVAFASGQSENFDFVVGADGLHSHIRELCFGPEERFEKYLGFAFAAFTIDGYEPRRPDIYMMYGVPGRQAARFAMRGNRTLVLLLWREDSPSLPDNDSGRRDLLCRKFGDIGWEARPMLEALDRATDLYVDRMSQIYMPCWSSGRIALVGDAAWAPSFLAGEGSGLGIIGAYVLAGELTRGHGDPEAFAAYEKRLRPFIESKQKMATHLGGAFVPKSRFGVGLRNFVASTFNNPLIAKLVLASGLRDDIDLPNYGGKAA